MSEALSSSLQRSTGRARAFDVVCVGVSWRAWVLGALVALWNCELRARREHLPLVRKGRMLPGRPKRGKEALSSSLRSTGRAKSYVQTAAWGA
jgi:hypothetical protein